MPSNKKPRGLVIMPHCVMTMAHQHRNYMVKTVSKVDKFSAIACSIISYLVVEIFMQKNSIVTKFCHLILGVPLLTPTMQMPFGRLSCGV